MGFTNFDSMLLTNGMSLCNCYISMTPGVLQFPNTPPPLIFAWSNDSNGNKAFTATGSMYIYASQSNKDAGCSPLQMSSISLPGDGLAQGVFGVFYSNLQGIYTHTQRS